MKKDMPLEGLRWSRDSGSALYDTPPNGRSRTGWGGGGVAGFLFMYLYTIITNGGQRGWGSWGAPLCPALPSSPVAHSSPS